MTHHINIDVGTTVLAWFESPDTNNLVETLGEIIDIKQDNQNTSNFVATVLWDNGFVFAMNALFFNRTVKIINQKLECLCFH